ncbi:hypothetical protein [uncultured Megasphaera sp.]|uniref:hypothetical protein n=1 Tax=uncultured Megasphaera sp. TaxID=165188 RepID=UPI002805AA94|nr:hypothetical protein [uncultured Megasphaera sp.]
MNNGTLPATASVSQRACQNMQHLVDIGLVQLPAGCRNVAGSHFTRDEMTNLTLQAMSRLGMDAQGRIDGTQDVRRPGYRETLALRSELYKDLQNKGMITDPTLLTDLSPSSEATDEKKDEERKYKISGEIRYDYVKHSGNPRWNWRDSELRSRLFLEGRINDNWHAFGMIESTKHFLGHDHGEKDDVFNDKRLYVRGMLGNAAITAQRLCSQSRLGQHPELGTGLQRVRPALLLPAARHVRPAHDDGPGRLYGRFPRPRRDLSPYAPAQPGPDPGILPPARTDDRR